MQHDAINIKEYSRLTLLSKGLGMNNNFFEQKIYTENDIKPDVCKINNITFNIKQKIKAQLWLKEFTK